MINIIGRMAGRINSLFPLNMYIKNREVEIDNTSYSHITSWQSQSLGNRSPNKVEVSSGINSAQASASNIKELRGEGFVKPILLL